MAGPPCLADLPGSAPPPHSKMKMLKGQRHPRQRGKGAPGGPGRLWVFAGSALLRFTPASASEGSLQSGCSSCLGSTNPLTEPLLSTPTTSNLVTPLPPSPHRSPPLQPLPDVFNTKFLPALSFPSCSAFLPWEAFLARCSPVHSLVACVFALGSLSLPIPTLHPNTKTISLRNTS